MLPNLPIIHLSKDTLRLIGNKLVSFKGFVESEFNSSSPIIIVKLDVNVKNIKLVEININGRILLIEPRIVTRFCREK